MENLKRYNIGNRGHGLGVSENEVSDGKWVKFSDIKDILKTPTNTARDAICPHWETYNRGGSGEFGACNCGGKISSGQTAPVA